MRLHGFVIIFSIFISSSNRVQNPKRRRNQRNEIHHTRDTQSSRWMKCSEPFFVFLFRDSRIHFTDAIARFIYFASHATDDIYGHIAHTHTRTQLGGNCANESTWMNGQATEEHWIKDKHNRREYIIKKKTESLRCVRLMCVIILWSRFEESWRGTKPRSQVEWK